MGLGRFGETDEVILIYFFLFFFIILFTNLFLIRRILYESKSSVQWLCDSQFLPSGQQGAWNLHHTVLASLQPLNLGFASVAGDIQLPF